jgi:hypothetical protein
MRYDFRKVRTFSKFALILGLSISFVSYYSHSAEAKKHSDDGGDDEGDEDTADDQGDKGDTGGDDTGGDEDNPDDKDQPLVTAGGLFTLNTYPVRELARPLTMTKKVTQMRLGIGTDISAKGAFGSVGADLDVIYGMADNFEIIGGLNSAYNFNQFSFYGGFEGALVYDVVDIRLAANVHRNAIPAIHTNPNDPNSPLQPGYGYFCDPPRTPGEMATGGDLTMGIPPTMCSSGTAMMPMGSQTVDPLPTGDYLPGGTQFSIDLGFPFRYSFTKEVAIVALQTLISFDFNSIGQGVSCAVAPFPCKYDHMNITQTNVDVPDGMGGTTQVVANLATPTGNSAKPDLKPSVGIATNPISALSLVIFAQLRIPDFDTAAGAFQIPVSLRAEFSPNQKFDIGLTFTLLNVKPPDPQSPLDNRFISTFMQARF